MKIVLPCLGLQLFFHCILILNHQPRSQLVDVEYEKVLQIAEMIVSTTITLGLATPLIGGDFSLVIEEKIVKPPN